VAQLFSNNAKATLLGSISAVATSLTLSSGSGVLFPTIVTVGDFFIITIEDSGVIEIVKAVATSGDIFTIQRAQEGTTARAWNAGTSVELRLTAGAIQKIQNDMGTSGVVDLGLGSTVDGNTIWHAGNDGTGSGLDADTVDGQHASAFAGVASPAFTGVPTAPTAALDTDTTQIATTQFVLNQAYDSVPAMNGTGAAGASERYARGNHVHPSDTSRAPLLSPVFTGQVSVPMGSVSGPGMIFSGDTNTGWYSPAADQIAMVAGGVEIVTSTASGATLNGKLTTSASISGRSGLNIPHGTDPSSPVNGDIWSTTTELKYQLNGSTKNVAFKDYVDTANALKVSKSGDTMTGDLTFSGTGRRIFADFSNATLSNRLSFQTSTTNSATSVQALPSGTGVNSNFTAMNTSDPNNTSRIQLAIDNTLAAIFSNQSGSGTNLPLTFWTAGSERARIATGGNVSIGTATDLGSKLNVEGTLRVNDVYVKVGKNVSGSGGNVRYVIDTGVDKWLTGVLGSAGAVDFSVYDITNAAERLRVLSSNGDVLVGGTSSDGIGKLQVTGKVSFTDHINFVSSGTHQYNKYGAGGWEFVHRNTGDITFYTNTSSLIPLTLKQDGTATVRNRNGVQQLVDWHPGQVGGGSRTLTVADIGQTIVNSSAGATFTVSNIGADGDMIQILNYSTGTCTIAASGVTLTWAKGGSNSTGSRTVAVDSVITLYRLSSSDWRIWGNGIT
jgi:hypothetical protein